MAHSIQGVVTLQIDTVAFFFHSSLFLIICNIFCLFLDTGLISL